MLTGFARVLRRSELVSLDVERLLEKSKTDKDGKGAEIMIVSGRNPVPAGRSPCPQRSTGLTFGH